MTSLSTTTVFSGIRPSGMLHIGNYLGALKQWIDLQGQYPAYFCIVDYHAITTPYDPKVMRAQVRDVALDYLAAGLDPKTNTIFVQSQVPEHTELAWILGTLIPFGELQRMTQWKEKMHSKSQMRDFLTEDDDFNFLLDKLVLQVKERINGLNKPNSALIEDIFGDERRKIIKSDDYKEMKQKGLDRYQEKMLNKAHAGLLYYPVLMAADILLYKAALVPVGEDQVQHIELTRDIARKFNNAFGQTFPEPKAKITKAKRIMSLIDPLRKMAKSDGPKSYIAPSDEPNVIRTKLASAVTDTGGQKTDAMSPGVANLFLLLNEFAPDQVASFQKSHADGTILYKELKESLADAIVNYFAPFRTERKRLAKSTLKVDRILKRGAIKARDAAIDTMEEVRRKIGVR